MQRVIVLPTHHVADDGVSIDLSGDRFHIGGSERAEVAEDEMQIKIEGGNKGGKHQALLPHTTVAKRLGDFTPPPKFKAPGVVTDCRLPTPHLPLPPTTPLPTPHLHL